MNRTNRLFLLGLTVTFAALGIIVYKQHIKGHVDPIRIGILTSKSGALESSEKNILAALELAIDEVNKAGGINGRMITAVIGDGKSDELEFAREAERLIKEQHVSALFGCWTSASRRAVTPVVEQHKIILFYPIQFEGVETTKYIVYLGGTPNQTLLPAATWGVQHLGSSVYLIGSDYIFPHVAHHLLKLHIPSVGGSIVGESFIPLSGKVTPEIIARIAAAKPNFIINTINGAANVSLFQELHRAKISAETTPIISLSISEPELSSMENGLAMGSYIVSTYFQSYMTEANIEFIQAFQNRYGKNRTISAHMHNAYNSIKLWAEAVKRAGTLKSAAVLDTLPTIILRAPGSILNVDTSRYARHPVMIGKVDYEEQCLILWNSVRTIPAVPYPSYLTPDEWNTFVQSLYTQWGSRWSAP